MKRDISPILLAKGKKGRYYWDWVLMCVEYYEPKKRRPSKTLNIRHNYNDLEEAYRIALIDSLSLPVGEENASH